MAEFSKKKQTVITYIASVYLFIKSLCEKNEKHIYTVYILHSPLFFIYAMVCI